MSLRNKSLVQLRSIAQGYGIADIFSKDPKQLIQDIELRQQAMVPTIPNLPSPPEYDARLMTKPPSRKSDRELIEEMLAPYVARGMHLEFPDEESWAIRWDKRTDTGSVRMPVRIIMKCAEKVMK